MTIRELIIREFTTIAESRSKILPPLTDDLRLVDTGLDSLNFAAIVAHIEDILGFDPFNQAAVVFPLTFGELVRLYENRAPQRTIESHLPYGI